MYYPPLEPKNCNTLSLTHVYPSVDSTILSDLFTKAISHTGELIPRKIDFSKEMWDLDRKKREGDPPSFPRAKYFMSFGRYLINRGRKNKKKNPEVAVIKYSLLYIFYHLYHLTLKTLTKRYTN